MSITKRPFLPIEFEFLRAECMIQLALDFNSQKAADDALIYLKKSVIPLHLKLIDNDLTSSNDEVPVYKLPDGLDLQDAAYYAYKNYSVPYSQAFASLSTGNKRVILNVDHLISDGGYFKFLVDNLYHPPISLPHLHTLSADVFKEEISKNIPIYGQKSNPDLNRLHPKSKNRIYTAYDDYYDIKKPASSFRCYDHVKRQLSQYTESLWMAHVISSAAFNGSLPEKACVATLVDLRKYLKVPLGFEHCHMINTVDPCAPLSSNMSLSEVSMLMREDLAKRLKRGEQFAFNKIREPEIPGLFCEITNMGPINIKPPITDAWASLGMKSTGIISLMSFSVKSHDRDDIHIRMRFPPACLSLNEANRYGKCIEYMLTNVDLKRNVGDVYDEVSSYYKHL